MPPSDLPVTTEFCHVANKEQFQTLLKMMDEFYFGDALDQPKGKPVVNMNNIKKFGMDAVERLAGEGGEQFDADKMIGEQLNRVLNSYRNDKFYEAKMRADQRARSNNNEQERYMDRIQRNLARAYNKEVVDVRKQYAARMIDANLSTLKDRIAVIQRE